MADENIIQKFSLKYKGGTRNYLVEQINQNELLSKKYENVCAATLASAFTGWVPISVFA